MITDTKTRTIEASGKALDEADYHINPDNIVHITQILRNMYSNPVLAVVREYTSNAIDAHKMAKCNDPIEIHLPTVSEPWFSVRDFGGGLDEDETKELLYGFGSSGEHKRNSNDQIGGFGIGCKCAFAVTDSFTYSVCRDGTIHLWNCYLDENDMGKAKKLSASPANGVRDGIEVKVPVLPADMDKYKVAVLDVFEYLEETPTLVNSDVEIVKAAEPLHSGDLCLDINGTQTQATVEVHRQLGDGPWAIVGGAKYEVDIEQLDTPDGEEARLLNHLILRIGIGTVQLAPNREQLQYSARTKRVLSALLHAAVKPDFVNMMLASVSSTAKTIGQLAGIAQLFHCGKALKNKWISPTGRLKFDKEYTQGTEVAVLSQFMSEYSYYGTKPGPFKRHTYREYSISTLMQDNGLALDKAESMVLVLCDKLPSLARQKELAYSITYVWRDDLSPHYKNNKLFVWFVSKTLYQAVPWMTDGTVRNMKESDITLIGDTTLTWHTFGTRARRVARPASGTGGTGGVRYSQHGKKLVKLKAPAEEYDSRRASSHWEGCKAKEVEGGVYAVLTSFAMAYDDHNKLLCPKYGLNKIKDMFGPDATVNLDVVPLLKRGLYGVKTKDAPSLEKAPEFVHFEEYIKKCFISDFNNGNIDPRGFFMNLLIESARFHSDHSRILDDFQQYLRNIVNADEVHPDVRRAATVLHGRWEKKTRGNTVAWAKFLAHLSNAFNLNVYHMLVERLDLDWCLVPRDHDLAVSRSASCNPDLTTLYRLLQRQDNLLSKCVERVLRANVPMSSFLELDQLFGINYYQEVTRMYGSKEEREKLRSSVQKLMAKQETYGIMVGKEKGDE